MKRSLLIGSLLFVAQCCHAQNTTVTATVTDANMQPYAFSTGYAALVCPGNQAATYNGFSIPRSFTITGFDGTGTFTQVLYDVSVLVPTGCGYQWHITYKDGVTNFITGTITSVTGSAVNESVAISAFAVLLPPAPVTTPPGGSNGQLQYNNSGTFGGVLGTSVTGGTGAILLTAGADATTPLAIASHSSTQSKPLFDVNMNSTFTPDAPLTVRGFGLGIVTQGGGTALAHFEADAPPGQAPSGWFVSNKRSGLSGSGAPFGSMASSCSDTGICQITGGGYDANGNYTSLAFLTSGTGLVIENSENNNISLASVVTIAINPSFAGPAPTHDILHILPGSGNGESGFDVNTNLFFNGSTSGTAKLGATATGGQLDYSVNGGTFFPLPQLICSGQIALTTGAISSGTRATNTLTCTGLSASTDTIDCTFSGDTNAVTGYAPSASGGITLKTWASTNTINVDQVNNTSGSITPGAATINCKGIR